MALFSDITKGLFGDSGSEDTIRQALAEIQKIKVPTAESMQITLQKLVQAGVLTPEQAETMLIEGNAFDDVSSSNAGLDSELDVMSKLQNITDQGGRDATEQADLQDALNAVAAQNRGMNEATLQQAAQRGTLTGGQTLASQLLNNSMGAQQANTSALRANADAQARQMQALNSLGTLGGNVQGQIYGADANKANAANAIAQFNAQQSNAMNQFNTGAKNQAQQFNLQNAQDISNKNVGNENANRERNSNLIQQNFTNQLNKAQASMGGAQNLANQQQSGFNQNMGLWGQMIGSAATAASGGAGNPGGTQGGFGGGPPSWVNQDQYKPKPGFAHGGPINLEDGGHVPGQPMVPGDSPMNDTVEAKLSPGEVVLPRTVVQNPTSVHEFLKRVTGGQAPQQRSVNPQDISAVLTALTQMREGTI